MPAEPASSVSEWLPLLPSGPALDLACGTGRHTLLLASQGMSVTAIDWSGAALDILEDRAHKARIQVGRRDSAGLPDSPRRGIRLIQANLEEIRLPPASFSLILCLQYLQCFLFTQMVNSLQPGGILLFETFTRAQINYAGGPRNPAYLLEAGELRTAFPELHILIYRELNAGRESPV